MKSNPVLRWTSLALLGCICAGVTARADDDFFRLEDRGVGVDRLTRPAIDGGRRVGGAPMRAARADHVSELPDQHRDGERAGHETTRRSPREDACSGLKFG